MQVMFEIIGEPKGKGRHRAAISNGHIHTYTPESTAQYENLVKVIYLQQIGNKRLQGAIKADILAAYAIPRTWSKKRIEAACKGEITPQKKPDTDNIAKIVLDSLNGVAYDDDKQVIELHVKKVYGTYASVSVTLEEL